MTEPYYDRYGVTVHHGDCLGVLAGLPDSSVHAVVTDPPYSLAFMGREWDRHDSPAGFQSWCKEWSTECARVLRPGGHLIAFGGSRTWHRLAAAVEDAGFEIRDSIAWLYASGFPKSLDVSKAIDKARDERGEIAKVQEFLNGVRVTRGLRIRDVNSHFCFSQTGGGPASKWMTNKVSPSVPTWEQWLRLKDWLAFGNSMDELVRALNARKGEGSEEWNSRPDAGYSGRPGMAQSWRDGDGWTGTASKGGPPVRETAQQWQGWGTALKPAFEPIVVARKPLAGTVAGNVLEHGVGALNIDGCRVDTRPRTTHVDGNRQGSAPQPMSWGTATGHAVPGADGRWPTNVVLTHAATPDGVDLCVDGCVPGCPVRELDEQSGISTSPTSTGRGAGGQRGVYSPIGAQGRVPAPGDSGGASRFFPVFRFEAKAPAAERPRVDGVAHPTVKPLALMRWLVRLVTPPGGTVLDPFLGSGTTAHAARAEGFRCIGVEREESYLPLIRARLDGDGLDLFGGDAA